MAVNLNGDLSQWSLGETFAACASGQMAADGFRLHDTSAAVHTLRRSADVPSIGACGRIIHGSLEVEVTTADASLGATDVTAVTYRGEGSEWAELAGEKAVTLMGYAKTNCPGFYNVVLSNGPETLHAAEPVLISATDYWTKFAVHIERPSGVIGTDWWIDTRVGYTVALVLMAGSSMVGNIGTWESGVKFGGSQQTNFNATLGNKFKVAGLRVCAYGDARESYQPPEITEQACLRYLQGSFARGVTPATGIGWGTGETMVYAQVAGAAGNAFASTRLSPMRKTPTMTGYNLVGASNQARAFTHGDCTGTTFDTLSDRSFRLVATTPVATTLGESIGLHWMANAALPALGVSVGS